MSDILDVNLVPVEKHPEHGELADKIYYECMFCGKRVGLYPQERNVCEKLSGDDFYCVFCLRNNFYTKNNRNILILSFRAIIGYYYYNFYLNGKKMYFSQIEDYISAHVKVGLKNPIFNYDPDTMYWFIDFSKVGRGNKKIKINDVLKTIVNIGACFNLDANLCNNRSAVIYERYKEAIEKFYSSRWRPQGKKILIPTLQGCDTASGNTAPGIKYEDTRNFSSKRFVAIF